MPKPKCNKGTLAFFLALSLGPVIRNSEPKFIYETVIQGFGTEWLERWDRRFY